MQYESLKTASGMAASVRLRMRQALGYEVGRARSAARDIVTTSPATIDKACSIGVSTACPVMISPAPSTIRLRIC